MLTIHHLGKSQSERIIWLCEELGVPYQLHRYDRDPMTMLAPAEYRQLHPLGAAPVITDDELTLAESGAIIEYIITKYGDGGLVFKSGDPNYIDYIYWFHFANGTLQPAIGRHILLTFGGVPSNFPMVASLKERQHLAISAVDDRLASEDHIAGPVFSAADIMIVFSLTTMRYFAPYDLAPYPNIVRYLQRIARRPAYQAAMAKGDPDMPILLD